MLEIKNLLEIKPSSSKIKSERSAIVSDFVERLNKEREGTIYKPLTARAVAIKMAHMSVEDLYWFYKNCETAKCGFSKAWWGAFKKK